MKILVLGCYREQSGWGETASAFVHSLHQAGADVACRAIQFSSNQQSDSLCRSLERKSFPGGSDVLVTHAPPYSFGRAKNGGLHVGAFFAETHPLPALWARQCATQDLLLTTHDDSSSLSTDPRIGRPFRRMNVARQPALYQQDSVEPACLKRAKSGGRTVFYAVGEWVKRKNFVGLIRSYYATFRPDEPVCLLLKTGISGQSAEYSRRVLMQTIEEAKRGCKLSNVPAIEVETERLSWPEMLGLHRGADIFALPARGEGWCIPAFDAAACGRALIVPEWGGFSNYLCGDSAWLIPTRLEPVFGEGDCHASLFTGRQTWADPCLWSFGKAMREAYEKPEMRKAKASLNADLPEGFSPAQEGARLLDSLSAALDRAV